MALCPLSVITCLSFLAMRTLKASSLTAFPACRAGLLAAVPVLRPQAAFHVDPLDPWHPHAPHRVTTHVFSAPMNSVFGLFRSLDSTYTLDHVL